MVNTLFHRRGGFVVKLLDEVIDVGVGIGYVTRLQRQHFLLCFLAQRLFDAAM